MPPRNRPIVGGRDGIRGRGGRLGVVGGRDVDRGRGRGNRRRRGRGGAGPDDGGRGGGNAPHDGDEIPGGLPGDGEPNLHALPAAGDGGQDLPGLADLGGNAPDGDGSDDDEEVPELLDLPDLGVRVTYMRIPSWIDPDDFCVRWGKHYKSVITKFRAALAPEKYYGEEAGDDMRIMQDVPIHVLHHLVLYLKEERYWLVLCFRVRDGYLIGFMNRHDQFQSFDTNYGFRRLVFSSDYGDLQRISKSTMFQVNLGMYPLLDMIQDLRAVVDPPSSRDNEKIAKGFFVSAIMFAEAARFNSVFKLVFDNSRIAYFNLPAYQNSHIRNWSKLSKCVIAAHEHPEMMDIINNAIEHDHALEFLKPDGLRLTNIGDVQSLVRVISRQSVADSISLFQPHA